MITKKGALLAGMLAATMVEQERNFYKLTSHYDGLDELTYRGSGQKSYSKSPLTKKQKKARKAAKLAKKSRKKNR